MQGDVKNFFKDSDSLVFKEIVDLIHVFLILFFTCIFDTVNVAIEIIIITFLTLFQ